MKYIFMYVYMYIHHKIRSEKRIKIMVVIIICRIWIRFLGKFGFNEGGIRILLFLEDRIKIRSINDRVLNTMLVSPKCDIL